MKKDKPILKFDGVSAGREAGLTAIAKCCADQGFRAVAAFVGQEGGVNFMTAFDDKETLDILHQFIDDVERKPALNRHEELDS